MRKFIFILTILLLATTAIIVNADEDDTILVYEEYEDFNFIIEEVEEIIPFFAPIVTEETTGQFLNRVFNAQLTYINVHALERNIFALQEQINTYMLATFVNELEREDFQARQQLAQAQVLNQLAITSYIASYVEDYYTALLFTNLNDILQARATMNQVLTQHGLTYANHQLQVATIMGPRIINIEHMSIDDLTTNLALANAQILTASQGQNYGDVPTTWPVLGRFTSGFGFRADPINGQLSFHTGVDLAAPVGTGNYDAVILGHTQFGKIQLSKENQLKYYEEQFYLLVNAIAEAKEADGGYFTVKQMEKVKSKVKDKLDELYKDKDKDSVITFEQLGCDKLFVDEADLFKNLALYSKMRNVAGLNNSDAQKSSDLFMKTRYMDEMTTERFGRPCGTVFATGTPEYTHYLYRKKPIIRHFFSKYKIKMPFIQAV